MSAHARFYRVVMLASTLLVVSYLSASSIHEGLQNFLNDFNIDQSSDCFRPLFNLIKEEISSFSNIPSNNDFKYASLLHTLLIWLLNNKKYYEPFMRAFEDYIKKDEA